MGELECALECVPELGLGPLVPPPPGPGPPSVCILPNAHAPTPTANMSIIIPAPPAPFTLFHHAWTAGARADPITTSISADANPAAKLLTFGFSEGRYRKPDPAECSGMMNISYFPFGRPEVLGFSPCGGGGGGFMMVVFVCELRSLHQGPAVYVHNNGFEGQFSASDRRNAMGISGNRRQVIRS